MRRLIPLLIAFFALAPPADAAWIWPVSGDVITPYRNGTDPYATGQHRGIDIEAAAGTPILAAASGEVRFAGTAGSSGLTISIRTADGYDTSYLHLSSLAVRAGAHVSEGARIGAVGTTGTRSATAPHLHFGVRDAGTRHDYHDPLAFLPPAPPPARAPEPSPPAPATAPQPAPPAAAPVAVPHAAPKGLPRAAPQGRPRAAPQGRPRMAPRRLPLASPNRVPVADPHPPVHAAPAAARRAHVPAATRQHMSPVPRGAPPATAPRPVGTPSPLPALKARSHRAATTSDAHRPDLWWAAACAVLLLAAGLLGMTGDTRRRPRQRKGEAFSLAKWQGKTPNPAQPPRG